MGQRRSERGKGARAGEGAVGRPMRAVGELGHAGDVKRRMGASSGPPSGPMRGRREGGAQDEIGRGGREGRLGRQAGQAGKEEKSRP